MKTCTHVERPEEGVCCRKCAQLEAGRRYYYKNRDAKNAQTKKWQSEHQEAHRLCKSIYAKQHRDAINAKKKSRYDSDLNYRLSELLRSRLRKAVIRTSKAGSAVRDLGCSIGELRTHLESLFQPGMSWDNYGQWHIDHIRPLVKFDLTNREDFLQACRYTNLQPLWAEQNLSKGSRIEVSYAA